MILDSDHAIPLEVDYYEQSVNGWAYGLSLGSSRAQKGVRRTIEGGPGPRRPPTVFV